MEGKVLLFNRLPRPKQSPSGLLNHWVFGVYHVDLNPLGDFVMAVHPQCHFVFQGGPAQILSLATGPDRAEAIIPCLLHAFIREGTTAPAQSEVPAPFAPWTWSTLDSDMAEAVQDGLRRHGVRPELCKVGICTADEREFFEKARASVFKMVMETMDHAPPATVGLGDATRCHGCGMRRQFFFQPLKNCARCKKAFYHSRECQKKHWQVHKPACLPPGTVPDLDAHAYYNSTALADPSAQALMKSLNLEPPLTNNGILLPLRRLVMSGKDTPKNMELLFGPQWERQIRSEHEEVRLECLLDPPPGSPCYVLNAHMDDTQLVRSLRTATEAERRRVQEVREMQALIRQRVGVGKSPSSSDMQAILAPLGPACVTQIATYTLAVNTMDQGVPSGGHRT